MRAVALAFLVAVAATAQAQGSDDVREGDRFFDEGNWNRAAKAYDAAIRNDPDAVPAGAFGKRAAVYILQGDLRGGLAFVRGPARKHHPGAPEVLEQEALLLWELGQRADAVQVAQQVVSARPSTWSSQRLLGEYYAARDPARTASAYQLYLAHRPADREDRDVLPRSRLGLSYLALARSALRGGDAATATRQYQAAAEQFEIVLHRHGKRPHAKVNAENGLCAAYAGLGRLDEAISICERAVNEPSHVDAAASAWFNLARAYLGKNQAKLARKAIGEYMRLRHDDARGQQLVGDSYFAERRWREALDAYLAAESRAGARPPHDQVALLLQIGKCHRRLGPLELGAAIDRLEAARAIAPQHTEVIAELGATYLGAGQDARALVTVERMINGRAGAALAATDAAQLLALAGKALYNLGRFAESRRRFEEALAQDASDGAIRRRLVEVIVRQAAERLAAGDARKAQALLGEGLEVDANSPTLLINQGLLSLLGGDCDLARTTLGRVSSTTPAVTARAARLLARAHLCLDRPDPAGAAEHYAIAEREARRAGRSDLLAEVYAEWAPLVASYNLDDAIDKLAAASAMASPPVATVARRNLVVVLLRRGFARLRDGQNAEAAADFQQVGRDRTLLRGREAAWLELGEILILLDRREFEAAAARLRPPAVRAAIQSLVAAKFSDVGARLLVAYTESHGGSIKVRRRAAVELTRVAVGNGETWLKELAAATWEQLAYDEWQDRRSGEAQRALRVAARWADSEARRRIAHNRLVTQLSAQSVDELAQLGATPPEALINLGIAYEQRGEPRQAYEAWRKAKSKGATSRDLSRWIDAKQRIYGY